jgi:hypothetical protein
MTGRALLSRAALAAFGLLLVPCPQQVGAAPSPSLGGAPAAKVQGLVQYEYADDFSTPKAMADCYSSSSFVTELPIVTLGGFLMYGYDPFLGPTLQFHSGFLVDSQSQLTYAFPLGAAMGSITGGAVEYWASGILGPGTPPSFALHVSYDGQSWEQPEGVPNVALLNPPENTERVYVRFSGRSSVLASFQVSLQLAEAPPFQYDLPAGWSMVSLPLVVEDASLNTIFPDAVSLFGYDAGYQSVSELEPGLAYFLRLADGGLYPLWGNAAAAPVLDLPGSWAMASVGATPVAVSCLKEQYPCIVSVYGFDNGYQRADYMVPGAGYWVNTSAPCQVDTSPCEAASLPPLGKALAASAPPRADGVVWAASARKRQQILLGVGGSAVAMLPPQPPAGVLDLRAEVGGVGTRLVPRSAGPAEHGLLVQGTDVTLGWDLPASQSGRWELVLDGIAVPLDGSGTLGMLGHGGMVSQAGVLRAANATPATHKLHPSYPNPFNPGATIPYQLASEQEVILSVWNPAGQMVRELVRTRQPAGSYSVTWDARSESGGSVANGVYLCQLRVGDFQAVRKMALVR